MKFGVGPQCLVAMNNATHYSVVKTQAFCYTVVVVLTIVCALCTAATFYSNLYWQLVAVVH